MKTKKIYLEETFNTGNYTNKKLGIEANIDEFEDEITCFIELSNTLKESFKAILEEEIRLREYELEKDRKAKDLEDDMDDLPF